MHEARRAHRIPLTLAALATALGTPGCWLLFDDGSGCSLDSDCSGSSYCYQSSCELPCHGDFSCDSGDRCQDGRCEPWCKTEACCDDTDCPPGNICVEATCVTPCTADSDCDVDEYCDRDAGFCRARALACDSTADCVEPRFCEFLEGRDCVDGVCHYLAKAAGTPCTDYDPCSVNDRCDGAGYCHGVAAECPMVTACSGDEDCDTDHVCFGDFCRRPDGDACGANEECLDTCVAGLCQTRPNEGEVCDDDADCGGSYVCVDVCVGALGGPCADDGECDSGFCVDDVCCDSPCDTECFSCDTFLGTCAPATGDLCDDGDPCTLDDTCREGLCGGVPYLCITDNPCVTSTCVGDGTCDDVDRDGEPCGICGECNLDSCDIPITAAEGADCAGPCTYCDLGTCVSYAHGEGGECEADHYCCGDAPLTCQPSGATCP